MFAFRNALHFNFVTDWMSPFDRVVCGEYNGIVKLFYFFFSFSSSLVLSALPNENQCYNRNCTDKISHTAA